MQEHYVSTEPAEPKVIALQKRGRSLTRSGSILDGVDGPRSPASMSHKVVVGEHPNERSCPLGLLPRWSRSCQALVSDSRRRRRWRGGRDESEGYRVCSGGGRQCLQPSSRHRVRISGFVRTKANRSAFGCLVCIRCFYRYRPSFLPPSSSLNWVQGHRRLGVLGLREAMGYAMTCRRRP